MRRLSYRRIIHGQVGADRAHDDFPGVEADPDLYRQTLGTVYLVTIAAQGSLHSQSSVTGAERMVLVGHRGTKESHDAIAEELIHRAFVAMHSLHHEVEHWLQALSSFFWIEAFNQCRGALDISKHHCDLLALAFEGGS
jgi:hypothetical protein